MTSDQEAVCGTCGGKGEIRYRAPHRVGEFVYTCRDCKGIGHIPPPVVPSDDERVCEYVDPLGKRCGHDAVAHISPAIDFGLPYANYCAECHAIADPIGPQFIHDFAPPTPSQDARERRGRRVREVWVNWAREQPNPKPSWLAPWEELTEPEREVDRRIGSALWGDGFADGMAALADAEKALRPSQDAEGDGLARLFHEAYERLAPSFGYETRVESAVPWEQVPERNRALMVATCREVESAIRADYEELVKAARDARSALVLLASDLREQFEAVVRIRDAKAKREATAALVLALIAAVETLQEDVSALRKGRGRR